jgi:hypothetical protein
MDDIKDRRFQERMKQEAEEKALRIAARRKWEAEQFETWMEAAWYL